MNQVLEPRWKRWSATSLLCLSGVVLGATLGVLWIRLFVPVDLCWESLDEIRDGLLGGALLGGATGLVLAVLLSTRAKLVGTAVATVAAAGILASLGATRQIPKALEPAVPSRAAFEPAFSAAVRVSHSEEVLAAVPPKQRPLPFSEGKVWTVGPEVLRTDWGPDFQSCVAQPSKGQLEAIVPLLGAAMSATGESAPACEEGGGSDLTLSFAMRLKDERASASLRAGCLPEHPALAALAQAISDLHQELDGRFTCRPVLPQPLGNQGAQ